MSKYNFKIETENQTHYINNYNCFLKTLCAVITDNPSFLEAYFLENGKYKTLISIGFKKKQALSA